jgi:DICT domain-containing protein/nitrogen-specific signal transduction histidine kinase
MQVLPDWRPQMFFKTSLVALSHAMEDQVLAHTDGPLIIATFQQERFYRQEAHRYRRIGEQSDQVYVLAAPETDFKHGSGLYESVAFDPNDALSQEWHLVVIGDRYANCLICRERTTLEPETLSLDMDSNRRFEGIWTFNRQASCAAAIILLDRILHYRPELTDKIAAAKARYLNNSCDLTLAIAGADESPINYPDPFVNRLVSYLQVGQYKLIKAYRAIASQEQKERLIHLMTTAIRRSLDPEEILQVAVEQLGHGLEACRCIIYRCSATDNTATISHEFLNTDIGSLLGKTWPLTANELFQQVATQLESLFVQELSPNNDAISATVRTLAQAHHIGSWLMVPVFYQDRFLGMIELHQCRPDHLPWTGEQISLVEAIANQVGVALIQAEAYANLEDLNEQLAALDRTRSNLVAITGHELRTPLSTIQVCLESLATEPDMSPELRQVMLNTALADAERMRKLIQDFLTLSQLESGRVEWNPEPLLIEECVELGVSNVRSRYHGSRIPHIEISLAPDLPLVQADGEWFVEVLAKLLDNACKFTPPDGNITLIARQDQSEQITLSIIDNGRGIEPNRLETVFDRFYQEEGALQRTTGGTGLGLAICRQIIQRWGGKIWAESNGKDQGSQFHFTIPIATTLPVTRVRSSSNSPRRSRRTS